MLPVSDCLGRPVWVAQNWVLYNSATSSSDLKSVVSNTSGARNVSKKKNWNVFNDLCPRVYCVQKHNVLQALHATTKTSTGHVSPNFQVWSSLATRRDESQQFCWTASTRVVEVARCLEMASQNKCWETQILRLFCWRSRTECWCGHGARLRLGGRTYGNIDSLDLELGRARCRQWVTKCWQGTCSSQTTRCDVRTSWGWTVCNRSVAIIFDMDQQGKCFSQKPHPNLQVWQKPCV